MPTRVAFLPTIFSDLYDLGLREYFNGPHSDSSILSSVIFSRIIPGLTVRCASRLLRTIHGAREPWQKQILLPHYAQPCVQNIVLPVLYALLPLNLSDGLTSFHYDSLPQLIPVRAFHFVFLLRTS